MVAQYEEIQKLKDEVQALQTQLGKEKEKVAVLEASRSEQSMSFEKIPRENEEMSGYAGYY